MVNETDVMKKLVAVLNEPDPDDPAFSPCDPVSRAASAASASPARSVAGPAPVPSPSTPLGLVPVTAGAADDESAGSAASGGAAVLSNPPAESVCQRKTSALEALRDVVERIDNARGECPLCCRA